MTFNTLGHAWTVRRNDAAFEEQLQRLALGAQLPQPTVLTFMGLPKADLLEAAQDVARRLGRALIRVDLSGPVSKYIGETEKNLRHVFSSAQASGAILLFEEADALFGKRSEVKEAHDRFAADRMASPLDTLDLLAAYRVMAIACDESPDAPGRSMPAFRHVRVLFPAD